MFVSPRSTGKRRASRGGMTLVEILIALAIMCLMVGAVAFGSGQTNSAKLRASATLVSGAIRVAYARASATSKPVRLAFDFTENTVTLEESEAPMLVQSKDTTGTGGAAASTENERLATAEADGLMPGARAPRSEFKAVVEPSLGVKGPKPLPRGITFYKVQSAHDDAPRTEGRAYLYFWPGGQTERASIALRVGEKTEEDAMLSLLVAPLTGKTKVATGAVPLTVPSDDKEASEREAPGGF
ncbi:MAG: prepilin-type N-terminal cleavage/methylation domain-containing protein [Polyangiaceae bacterium]